MTIPTPPLDYAPHPAVGDVAIARADGVTTITRRSGGRRIAGAVWPGVFMIATVGGVLALPVVHRDLSTAGVAVPLAIVGLFAAITATPAVVTACHPVRWAVTTDGVEVTARQLSQVARTVFRRPEITDVRVERVPRAGGVWLRPAVVIVRPDGGWVGLADGRPAELAVMAAAVRDGLGLGPDPVGESAFPPRRRTGRR